MKTLDNFKENQICLKSVYGGEKIYSKEVGTMHHLNGKEFYGVYISVYDTTTKTYSYYSHLGQPLVC